jgi:hypothetical protein
MMSLLDRIAPSKKAADVDLPGNLRPRHFTCPPIAFQNHKGFGNIFEN